LFEQNFVQSFGETLSHESMLESEMDEHGVLVLAVVVALLAEEALSNVGLQSLQLRSEVGDQVVLEDLSLSVLVAADVAGKKRFHLKTGLDSTKSEVGNLAYGHLINVVNEVSASLIIHIWKVQNSWIRLK